MTSYRSYPAQARSTEHGARSTEHGARSTEHGARSTEHGARSTEHVYSNLIIEGDNYDALRALKLGFSGRVKCIYIDPPYNTGNKDFVYNDRFVDKDHAWRHSLWCEFMFRRLELAKDLLAQDGVIFVSIDDNEVAHLRLLMDRVFGEGNFAATMVWQKSKKGDAKLIATTHEYVMAYVTDREALRTQSVVWRAKKPGVDEVLEHYATLRAEMTDHAEIRAAMMRYYRGLPAEHPAKAHKHYNWSDDRGLYFAADFAGPDDGRPNRPRYTILHPTTGQPCAIPSTGWRWEESRTKAALAEVPPRIHFGVDHTTIPCRKSYLMDVTGEPFTSVFYKDGRAGTLEVEKLLGPSAFSFPKDANVIEQLVSLVTNKDDIILDFFAGSGTTAHAVAKLNAADGGRRRFILVSSTEATAEQPEKNICRDVCAERVRRVMSGYKDVPGLGGSFAYLRTRRFKQGELLDIEHAQVWTALQLLHRERLTPPAEETLHWLPATEELDALAYLERVDRAGMAALKKHVQEAPAVRLYTWQPGIVKARLAGSRHVEVLAIPQSLARQFGFKGEVPEA